MDVWVLTRETGEYDDRRTKVLAVTSSIERAKKLAAQVARDVHEDAVARCMNRRAKYPLGTHSPNGPPRTIESTWPMPVLADLEWGIDPYIAGGLRCHRPDDRWAIFPAELDDFTSGADW